jgi:hypothetical protein
MRTILVAILAANAIASAATAASGSTEAALLELLNGREVGKPVDCLRLRTVRSSRIIDRTAVIFDAGGTLYLNRPKAGAELLVSNKAILTSSISGEICSGEAVQLFDAASGVQSGSVFLGQFVPYRKKQLQSAPYRTPGNGY